MEDPVPHPLYKTALHYDTAPDAEYELLKNAVKSFLGVKDDVKMMCRKEWHMGTFIDIYVKCASLKKDAHLAIGNDGHIHDASYEDH